MESILFTVAGVVLIVLLTTRFKVHAFFALLLASLLAGLGAGFPLGEVVGTIKDGFGRIMTSLGLIIVLGTTLGVLLEYSGSTGVMASFILRKLGEQRAGAAMSIIGFLVGLPIFCDSGFIVLNGVNHELAVKSRIPVPVMAGALATGLYSVHCLIPPHPGATAAASALGVAFGPVMGLGIVVALPAALAGYLWCRFAGSAGKTAAIGPVPTDAPSAEPRSLSSIQSSATLASAGAPPSVLKAFLPILVPIVAIAAGSLVSMEHKSRWLEALGDPVIALLIGVALAFAFGRSWTRDRVDHVLHDAVLRAGGVLVIIGAGGAFGAVLASTGIARQLSAALPLGSLGIIFPFLITSALKTAQGSSTVAIITASSMVQPLLPALGLSQGHGPLLCVLSMGAGSMVISHANDAYFWVVSRFSGIDLKTMLRVYSMATLLMGLTSFFVVYLLSYML